MAEFHASMALLALASALLASSLLAQSAAAALQGDVNGYSKIDIFDLAAVGLAFGSKLGDANWNQNTDLAGDGKIDIFDLATLTWL